MKNNNYENLEAKLLSPEERKNEKNNLQKSREEIKDTVKAFFHNFSQQYRPNDTKASDTDKEKLFLEEINYLDVNTSPNPELIPKSEYQNFSKEELQQLEENDPGYVNEKVLDYDNTLEKESNTYQMTGLHTGAIRWGDYATKEGVDYITLDVGKIVSRWGEETGTFLSDVGVNYDSLELPIIKEKNKQTLYEVLKSFPVEISKIAKQPWNEGSNGEEAEPVIQYRTAIPICALLREGYLKQVGNEKNNK